MNVTKYTLNKNVVIADKLFLAGDELYIQNYDPVNGRPQSVFMIDRTFIGTISADFYWQLESNLTKTLTGKELEIKK